MQFRSDALDPGTSDRHARDDELEDATRRQVVVRVFPLQVRKTKRFNRTTAEPTLLEGNCLTPFLIDGDVVLFDRTLRPADGDVVVAKLWYEFREDPARPRYALHLSVKQLRAVAGRLYLVCGDGYLAADEVEILGPVVGWHRPGWWRRPSMRRLSFHMPVRVAHG